MELHVRSFQVADTEAVTALAHAAAASVRLRRGGNAYLDLFDGLRERDPGVVRENLDSTGRSLFVGLLEGVAFGFCLVRREGGVLTIEAIYVDPEAREVGLGSALGEAAEQFARTSTCERLDAFVLPGDRQAKQLAESQSMKARLLTLSKTLEPLK
jgi:GNAT superfamily N-acetyltransferase